MKRLLFMITLFFLLPLLSCAVLTGSRNISTADSFFKKKQYSNAAATYRKMLQEHPDSFYAADARYGLAVTLASFDNTQKDYTQALHEFEIFYKLYPNDRRVPEVQNWIAVLRTLNDLSRSIEQLKRLDIRHEERRRK